MSVSSTSSDLAYVAIRQPTTLHSCDLPELTVSPLMYVCAQRRAEEGGSYHVRVSLARTGMYLQSFPLLPAPVPTMDELKARWETIPPLPRGVWEESLWGLEGGKGRTVYTASIIEMTATAPRWDGPPQPTGASPPEWLGPRL